jgi:primosomal protein N' (replication factor Y)
VAGPAKQGKTGAGTLPVARVAVDIALAHLDRPFDYLVPERLAEDAVPGCRVRVRFAGQLTGGYLLERAASSEHPGRLAALERVVSPEPVLSPEIAALAREVADRYAGTMADVLRLAIPPRHARVEAAAPSPEPAHPEPAGQLAGARADELAGPAGQPAGLAGQPAGLAGQPAGLAGQPAGLAGQPAALRATWLGLGSTWPGLGTTSPCLAAPLRHCRRNRGRGDAIALAGPSWPPSRMGERRGRCGRRCPARTGRRRSRAPRRQQPRAAGAR